LRVPGIGVTSAKRIITARKSGQLDFPDLKKLGVVLKRAIYFITAKGKCHEGVKFHENFIYQNLTSSARGNAQGMPPLEFSRQTSMFDGLLPDREDLQKCLTGQM
jgi:predicted DNA-binding helix-hairpin-helix protein